MAETTLSALGSSGTYCTPLQSSAEGAVCRQLEAAWPGVRVHRFSALDAVDGWLERDGRMCGVFELKCRSHARGHFDTVYLAMRKWADLTRIASAFDVAPLFVVSFVDALGYVDVRSVDARNHTVSGNSRGWHRNDREPLIEVNVAAVTFLSV